MAPARRGGNVVMPAYADSAFAIGAAHGVCEDYARAGVGPTGPYAIVCDGCSGSPDTDIGARVLALVAERHIRTDRRIDSSAIGRVVEDGMIDIAPPGAFDWNRPNPFDATLLIARFRGTGPFVDVWGDGAMAYCTRDRELRGTRIRAKEGAPPYLSYAWSNERLTGYLELVGTRNNRHACGLDGDFWWEGGEGIQPYTICLPGNVEVVAVFSDGVESFRDSSGVAIQASTVIHELMAFKTMRGAFVTRRFHACRRAWKARGWTHTDDLAMAAIYLGEEPAG